MAETLTAQQKQAVENRGGKLLVSAAAGSGKTKVLVDRLLSYLLDPVNPAQVDDFLIITYTKAAAAELRSKIAAKLTEHMASDPENRHLQHQMQRLYMAKISTVHSFCADILKEYAYLLDLPADFRVADENECRELREKCMQKMLDAAYDSAEQDANFRAFVDTQGLGRDDRLVPEILLKVFDSSRCHLDPDGWLDACVKNAQVSACRDASETVWGAYLMEDLRRYLDLQIEAMQSCAAATAVSEGMEKPSVVLSDTVNQLKDLRNSTCWDDVVRLKNIDYGRLSFSKKCTDTQLIEQIKAVRNACKKGLEKKLKSFSDDSSTVLSDLERSVPSIQGMVDLVKRFGTEFDRVKTARRILDFGDLEQRTLDLLLGKGRGGATFVAKEVAKRFREIMVDEYQDSNAVQDAIFTALTAERNNCFMVGDVKQSIYQFRLADPGIFLEKYKEYVDADDAAPGQGRKVLLTRNFRSGGAVLSAVNDVFTACMSENVGGLVYTEDEALVEGIPHAPLGEPETELWTVDVVDSTYDEEASFVADRIQQLLDGSHYVRQGEELRPIRAEDIAILLRSPGSVGGYFTEALANRGIRCTTGGGEDLLQTAEVSALRSLLQTVSNPRQDIPLIAALTSPVFGFTADDLAVFRSANRKCSIYDALKASDLPKAKAFFDTLSVLRRAARLQTLTELIRQVFRLTRMDSIYGAMADGDIRRGNLLAFYRMAAEYQSGGHRDLEQFLDHLSAMEEKGLITAGEQTAAGAVTLMSIHKSKGLEFPVVIVAGLSRSFNREDVRGQVLCDQQLGLGLSTVDTVNRVRYPTIAKRAIATKMIADSLSEELRVLYVALTRARDRLIMVYASKSLESDISDTVCRMDIGDRELLCTDAVCPGDWVLLAALQRTEAGKLFALGGSPRETRLGDPAWLIDVGTVSLTQASDALCEDSEPEIPEGIVERLQQKLSFRYAHDAATKAPSKQTVTQRKGRDKDAEVAEHTKEQATHQNWRNPGVKGKRGTEYGTAVHAVMQHIRYDACKDVVSVQEEIERLYARNFITLQQRDMVDAGKIANLFATEIGQKMQSCKEVLREFKFSILDDGQNYAPELAGEQILLQGVVDCALIEEDGITVLDFKTDYVTEDTISQRAAHYLPQVRAYADALGRIYGLPLKECLLYFFSLDRFVNM